MNSFSFARNYGWVFLIGILNIELVCESDVSLAFRDKITGRPWAHAYNSITNKGSSYTALAFVIELTLPGHCIDNRLYRVWDGKAVFPG